MIEIVALWVGYAALVWMAVVVVCGCVFGVVHALYRTWVFCCKAAWIRSAIKEKAERDGICRYL